MRASRSIAVYYEHPDWFRPLFAELERRSIPHVRLDASRHGFDPSSLDGLEDTLVFNRMSPSAWRRGRAYAISYTHQWLRYLDRAGVPVVNGLDAFAVETSKALQLSILHGLGLAVPRTRVVNHPTELPAAAAQLEFPIVVKPNVGGSGAGIARFDTAAELEAAVEQDAIVPSVDDVLLAQEYHAPRGRHIVRVETLDGAILYAVRVHLGEGAGFNLCPAEICRDASGATLTSAVCAAGAAVADVTVEAFDPPEDVCAEVAAIARAAGLDAGGVEYLASERDGRRVYYDVNALSNFVADPVKVLGFDPWIPLVDLLVKRAAAVRARGESLVPRATAPPHAAPTVERAVAAYFNEEMAPVSLRPAPLSLANLRAAG